MRIDILDKKASQARADELIDWLRRYAAHGIDSRWIDEHGAIPLSVYRDFGNHGVYGMYIPKEFGGLGLRTRDILRVLEQVAAIDLTLSFTVGFSVLCAHSILHHASPSFRRSFLPLLATGRASAVTAMTEPDVTGSDPSKMQATATPDGEGRWRLNGTKFWIPMAAWASLLLVFVRELDETGKPTGFIGFCVPRDAEGLEIGPELLNMGLKGFSFYTVRFNDVSVDENALLGISGKGMEVAQSSMTFIRMCLAAMCVGATKRCLQVVHNYASRREIVTGLLLKNPVILGRLDRLAAWLTATGRCLVEVADRLDQGQDVPEELCIIAKNEASELLGEAADQSIQFLGARGYSEANIIPKILRDGRGLRILEGPTETLNMFLGARVLAGSGKLNAFLNDLTGSQSESSLRLKREAEEILALATQQKVQLFSNSRAAYHWSCDHVGRVATFIVFDALLQAEHGSMTNSERVRALAWVQRGLTRLQKIRTEELSAQPNPDDLTQTIARYEADIGGVSRPSAKSYLMLDSLLLDRGD